MGRNFWNNLSRFLLGTSAMCFAADMLYHTCHCRYMPYSIFPFSYYPCTPRYYMPHYQNPRYTRQPRPKTISAAEAVETSYISNLGKNFLTNTETQFVTNDWITLDKKANKTNAEKLKLQGKYRGFIGHFAKSLIAAIDTEANGDSNGYLSKTEFQEYYLSQVQTADSTQAEIDKFKADADKIFGCIDLTKEGKLDWKEVSAFLAAADKSGSSGNFDGTIKKEDTLKLFDNILKNENSYKNTLKENYLNLFS